MKSSNGSIPRRSNLSTQVGSGSSSHGPDVLLHELHEGGHGPEEGAPAQVRQGLRRLVPLHAADHRPGLARRARLKLNGKLNVRENEN